MPGHRNDQHACIGGTAQWKLALHLFFFIFLVPKQKMAVSANQPGPYARIPSKSHPGQISTVRRTSEEKRNAAWREYANCHDVKSLIVLNPREGTVQYFIG